VNRSAVEVEKEIPTPRPVYLDDEDDAEAPPDSKQIDAGISFDQSNYKKDPNTTLDKLNGTKAESNIHENEWP